MRTCFGRKSPFIILLVPVILVVCLYFFTRTNRILPGKITVTPIDVPPPKQDILPDEPIADDAQYNTKQNVLPDEPIESDADDAQYNTKQNELPNERIETDDDDDAQYHTKPNVQTERPNSNPPTPQLREASSVKISPDGQYVAFVSVNDGIENLWVQRTSDLLDGEDNPRAVTFNGVYEYTWTYIGGMLLYLMDEADNEQFVLYSLDVREERPTAKVMTGSDAQAKIWALSYLEPDWALIGWNKRNSEYYDLFQSNLRGSDKYLLYRNDEYDELLFDNSLRLRLAAKENDRGENEYYFYDTYDNETKTLNWQPYKSKAGTVFVSFDRTGTMVYWIENEEAYSRLFISELTNSSNENVLFETSESPINFVWMHPTEFTPIALRTDDDHYHVLDDNFADVFGYVPITETSAMTMTLIGGASTNGAANLDLNMWLVAWIGRDPEVPDKYYLFDKNENKATAIFRQANNVNVKVETTTKDKETV